MSLLFDRALSVKACFTVKPEGNKGGYDTALVGKRLWDLLRPTDGTSRACLSIQPLHKAFKKSTQMTLCALTCWAVFDEDVRNLFLSLPKGLLILN